MKAGSAADTQMSEPSSNTTFVLDMTQASPTWQQTPSMAYPRSLLNLRAFPIALFWSQAVKPTKTEATYLSKAVYPAERWSPPNPDLDNHVGDAHTARIPLDRAAGLGWPGTRVRYGRRFWKRAERNKRRVPFPALRLQRHAAVTQVPGKIVYRRNFSVGTPDAAGIAKAVLIRTGAVTHAFDQNTDLCPFDFQQSTGGLTVSAPAKGGVALPGYYMLFLGEQWRAGGCAYHSDGRSVKRPSIPFPSLGI
jgi:hypothetical protein